MQNRYSFIVEEKKDPYDAMFLHYNTILFRLIVISKIENKSMFIFRNNIFFNSLQINATSWCISRPISCLCWRRKISVTGEYTTIYSYE